ncbi:MAG: Phosphotransferase enzyme family [Chloroflexi bacterium]|nr:Phosphotransferase enzyme family [Chloroflexota bacterium]
MSGLAGPLLSPGAAEALDPEAMSRRLAPFLEAAHPGTRVLAARVVAVAPGRRAVVAYDTGGPAGPGPALIGKVYADPGRAGRLLGLLGRLEELGIAAPHPVAHLRELGMAVFTAVAGRTLDQLGGAERIRGVEAAAEWLAGLHGSGLELDRGFDLATESRNLRLWGRQVAALHPSRAAAVERLLARLNGLAGGLRLSTAAPLHKDFHHQHTLIGEGGLVVIDLDEARAGDPAFDVAHFAANLRLLGLREATAGGGGLEAAFLDAYATRTGYVPDRRHRWCHAYTCLKIARQLSRGRGPAPAPDGAERERQLGLILDEGLRCPG